MSSKEDFRGLIKRQKQIINNLTMDNLKLEETIEELKKENVTLSYSIATLRQICLSKKQWWQFWK
jgi:predicted RNase H-like nuclease (RuvC/YqgF family)